MICAELRVQPFVNEFLRGPRIGDKSPFITKLFELENKCAVQFALDKLHRVQSSWQLT